MADLLPVNNSEEPGQDWLTQKGQRGIHLAAVFLLGAVLLSACLHLINLESIGQANTYYTAAVKSMLQSWPNFFFVAAEPGGSVTVDKPPLGLWVEALFAMGLGVNGIAVSLPNILSGILSVPVLYHLVKKHLGIRAGLVAAYALAVIPVVVAADRNNTMDGLLTFTLLLAAWAFIKAAESGRLWMLLLGAGLVGLGFNIKMMQAFLPLPAFFALYFWASRQGWVRKGLYLAAASLLIALLSLAWPLAVDSIPVDQRPFIGSSTDNTVMELIIGHNGINRLLGSGPRGNNPPQQPPNASFGPQGQGGGRGNGPFNPPPAGQGSKPQDAGQSGPPGGPPQQNGGPSSEVGLPGLLRFFKLPLAKELSWLLPFALISLILGWLAARFIPPLRARFYQAWILWGGWLLICLAFFSVAEFYHAYYMIMLAPALAGVIALGYAVLEELFTRRRRLASGVLSLMAGLTVVYQVCLAFSLNGFAGWELLAVGGGLLGGILLWVGCQKKEARAWLSAGKALLMASILIIPLIWSVLTVTSDMPNINLPSAYSGRQEKQPGPPGQNINLDKLTAYLQSKTQDIRYLVAVPNAFSGAPFVLATGRPVLYMGGFSGSDAVVKAEKLANMVENGDLRFVYYSGEKSGDPGVLSWVVQNCRLVPEFSSPAAQRSPTGSDQLYRCE
jgi:4-amino-4-deoxy-L-arabinose transferase-like glycosyltransferase